VATAQTVSRKRRKSQGRNPSGCETREDKGVATTAKFEKGHFASAGVETAARISFRHVETYLSIHGHRPVRLSPSDVTVRDKSSPKQEFPSV
jgi:hypothetical protein